MHLRIKRSDLKPGMFLVSHGQGTFHSPVVRIGAHLLTLCQIDSLVPKDVEEVLIDASCAMHLEHEEEPADGRFAVSLGEELHIAKRLYADALIYVKGFVDSVHKGTDIDLAKAKPLVESFIESVFRHEAASVTLFKLRGFDEYTYTHSINVSILAVLLGKHLGLDKPTLLTLGLAGLLHDAGKARIPADILNKPGKLNEREFAVIKTHTLEGVKILRRQKDMPLEVLHAVLEHHERHDGSGYPQGLKGEAIGRLARILAVVDVYDALTSRRVYKDAMTPAEALGLMFQWRGGQFSVEDVESFIRCIGVFPVGSFVRLSGGEFGIVVGVSQARPTRPEIKVVMDAKMRPQLPRLLDLEALEGTPEAQDIAEVLNPADHKIDLGRFLAA